MLSWTSLGRRLGLGVSARRLYLDDLGLSAEKLVRLEDQFFHNLRLRNGTFKSTARHRLDDLNAFLHESLPAQRPLTILDVGVSSGITTFEWSHYLQSRDIEHQIVASDFTLWATLLSVAAGLRVLVDSTGFPIQYELLRLGIRTSARNKGIDFPMAILRRVFGAYLRHKPELRRHVECAATQGPQVGGGSAPRVLDGVEARSMMLATRRLEQPPEVEFVEEDLFDPPRSTQRFTVVRAANILNPSYFSRSATESILCNLRARLVDRGVLVVARSTDKTGTEATVFRYIGGRFAVERRLGQGCPIDGIVTGLTGPPHRPSESAKLPRFGAW